jgi:hypothetical protein
MGLPERGILEQRKRGKRMVFVRQWTQGQDYDEVLQSERSLVFTPGMKTILGEGRLMTLII